MPAETTPTTPRDQGEPETAEGRLRWFIEELPINEEIAMQALADVALLREQAATEARRELLALCDEVDHFTATMRERGMADFVRLESAADAARRESQP